MGIDRVLKRRIFRITLAVFIAVIAIIYIALVQYSFTQYDGSWAAFVNENEIRKISDEPGLHFIPPGDQVARIPKSVMLLESPYGLVDIGSSRFNISFSILWRVTDPEAYLNDIIRQENSEKFIIDAALSELKSIAGSSDSPAKFFSNSEEFDGRAGSNPDLSNAGIIIEKLYITDFYPYISDIDKADFLSSDDKDIIDNLELADKIQKQFERDIN